MMLRNEETSQVKLTNCVQKSLSEMKSYHSYKKQNGNIELSKDNFVF